MSKLKREHVIEAMQAIRRTGVPTGAKSTKYHVIDPETGTRLPPKLVLSIATELATGEPFPRSAFSGGVQTNAPLERLGFEIIQDLDALAQVLDVNDLSPGDELSNSQLSITFSVGNSGGMRWSNKLQRLVLIADHTKSLYDDAWHDDTLYYTGMGQVGDQVLASQNKRLASQRETGEIVDLFEAFKPQVYTYLGQVALVGDVREAQQPDSTGSLRKVYVFPLKLKDGAKHPAFSGLKSLSEHRQKALRKRSLSDLYKLAVRAATPTPGRRIVETTQYSRNDAISELVKRLANGICDLCQAPAPFVTRDGPYLECHHVQHLAKGGADSLDNTVALCPNCHRRMHLLDAEVDKAVLRRRIQERYLAIVQIEGETRL